MQNLAILPILLAASRQIYAY